MVRAYVPWPLERRAPKRMNGAAAADLPGGDRDDADRLAWEDAVREVEETCRLGRPVGRRDLREPQ